MPGRFWAFEDWCYDQTSALSGSLDLSGLRTRLPAVRRTHTAAFVQAVHTSQRESCPNRCKDGTIGACIIRARTACHGTVGSNCAGAA